MSAPPSENSPNNQSHQSDNMSHSKANSETKSSNERIIPIHIEGRDEPVLPKNVPPTYSQQHSTPQPDRIFGKPTEHFTQFLPNEREARFGNKWPTGFPEEPVRQQRFQQQHAAPKPSNLRGEIPIPVQREVPTKHQQQQFQSTPPKQQTTPPKQPAPEHQSQPNTSPQQPPPEPPKPQPKPLSPLEQIQAIQKDVSALMEQVEKFSGKYKDKQYLYLDEMFTRNLIKLDNIDTQGQEAIRNARKEAIKCIEKTIGVLEAKAAAGAGASQNQEMQVDDKSEDKATENVTTEAKEGQNEEAMEVESCKSQSVAEEPKHPAQEAKQAAEEPLALATPMETEVVQNTEGVQNTESVEPKQVDNVQMETSPVQAEQVKDQPLESSVPSEQKVPEGGVKEENVQPACDQEKAKTNTEVKEKSDTIPKENETKNEETVSAEAQPTPEQSKQDQSVDKGTDDKKEKKDEKKDKKKGKKKVEKKEK